MAGRRRLWTIATLLVALAVPHVFGALSEWLVGPAPGPAVQWLIFLLYFGVASAVVALVLRDGLRPVGIGAVIGVVLGAATSRLLSSLLFGMSALDPFAYAGVALVTALVALAASYIPARRATRVDPLPALRAE